MILFNGLSIFSIPYVISVIIMLISSWDSILITSYDYGYFKETEIFFPFTTTYGNMAFNGIVFKRLLGFARESGIMQIFYILRTNILMQYLKLMRHYHY